MLLFKQQQLDRQLDLNCRTSDTFLNSYIFYVLENQNNNNNNFIFFKKTTVYMEM